MCSENNDLSTSEYKFTFRQTGSAFSSERHFSATSPETAREMFDFVCRKEDVPVDEVDLSVWNRWANRWDDISKEDSGES